MKKLIKILAFLVLLGAAGLVFLIWNINSVVEVFRPDIERTVSGALDRPVTLGAIDVEFWPSVALRIDGVKLSGDQSEEQAQIGALLINTSIGDLLGGSLSINEITIEDAQITIVRAQDGSLRAGGVALGKKEGGEAKGAPTTSPSGGTPGTEAPREPARPEKIKLAIDAVNVTDSRVRWVDHKVNPPVDIQLSEINASAREIDLRGKADIEFEAKLPAGGSLSASGSAGNPVAGYPTELELAAEEINLGELARIARAYGSLPPELTVADRASLRAKISTAAGAVELDANFNGTGAAVRYGELLQKPAGDELTLALRARAGLDGSVTAEGVVLKLGGMEVHAPFKLSSAGALDASLVTEQLSLERLAVYALMLTPYSPSGAINANLQLGRAGKEASPAINGEVVLSSVAVSLPQKQEQGGAETSPAPRISELNGILHFAGEKLTIKDLAASLAGQLVHVQGTVTNFSAPTADLSIKAATLALGELAAAFGVEAAALQGAELTNLDVHAQYAVPQKSGAVHLRSDAAQLAGLAMGAPKLDVTIDPQTFRLEPSTLGIFGGTLGLQGSLARTEPPVAAVNLRGTSLDAAQLSNVALKDSRFKLSGTIDPLTADVRLDTRSPKATAEGTVRTTVSKGAISGVNILGQALGKLNQIPGLGSALIAYIPEQYRGIVEAEETQFDTLLVDTSMGSGRINLRQVALSHTLYAVTGEGWTAFEGNMEIRGKLKLTSVLAEGMVLREPKLKLILDRDGSLVVPVLIQKKGDSVLVLPDMEDLLERAATNTAKEAAGRALEKVAPGLGKATDVLDSLFK